MAFVGGDDALLAVVRPTSTTPARILDLHDRNLSAGAADLVALEASLAPASVMISGEWISQESRS